MGRFWQSVWPVFLGVFITSLVATWNLSRAWSEAESESREKNLNAGVTLARESLAIEVDRVGDRVRDLLDRSFTVQLGQGDLYASEFEALALVSGAEGGWKVDWLESRENILNREKVVEEISRWPIENAKGADVIWTIYQPTATQTMFVVMTELKTKEGEPRWGVGFLSTSYFAKFAAGLNSDDNQVMFVDSTGNLYAHPELKYVGTKFTAHPVIVQLTKSQASFRLGEYKNTNGEDFLAGFAKVPKSNLFVAIVTQTIKAATVFRVRYIQVFILSFAIAILLSGLTYFFRDRTGEQVELLKKNIELLRAGHSEPPAKNIPATSTIPETGRLSLLTAVVRFMREPLNILAGYIQMIDADVKSSSGRDKLKKIDSELRKLKDFVSDLAEREKLQAAKQEVVSSPVVVSQIVASLRRRITDGKIQFEENLKTDAQLRGDFEEIKFSLKAMLGFAIDRLASASGDKKIIFNIEKIGGVLRFEFQISGAALNSDERRNLFRPFQFSLKDSQFHDLDLALAKTFIESAHGEVKIEAAANGFLCRVDFPTIQNQELMPMPVKEEKVASTIAPASTTGNESATPPPVAKQKVYESKKVSEVLGRKPISDSDGVKLPPAPDFTKTDVRVESEVTLTSSSASSQTSTSASAPAAATDNKGIKPAPTFIRKPKVNA